MRGGVKAKYIANDDRVSRRHTRSLYYISYCNYLNTFDPVQLNPTHSTQLEKRNQIISKTRAQVSPSYLLIMKTSPVSWWPEGTYATALAGAVVIADTGLRAVARTVCSTVAAHGAGRHMLT